MSTERENKMKGIDLNCDMGELKPGQERNYDAEIMPFISSCNIACGFHSGSPALMTTTIRLALAQGVAIGAHPSYKDRPNFGRVSLNPPPETLKSEIIEQITLLKSFVEAEGGRLHHVKPHGALYNDLAHDPVRAKAFAEAVRGVDPSLKVYVLAGTPAADIFLHHGLQPVHEGFADRAYARPDQLQSRREPGAVLHDFAAIRHQIDGFLQGQIRTVSDEIDALTVESLCLHSDTPGAVELGRAIHAHLHQRHVRIAPIR
ncbi:MAG: 5-oxoprolinase subunit PxpA [Bacteroidota bacterium]